MPWGTGALWVDAAVDVALAAGWPVRVWGFYTGCTAVGEARAVADGGVSIGVGVETAGAVPVPAGGGVQADKIELAMMVLPVRRRSA